GNRRDRLIAKVAIDLIVTFQLGSGGVPVALRHDEDPEPELGHDLGGFRTDGGAVYAIGKIRVGLRANAHLGNLKIFTLVREAVVLQRLDHDFGRLDEALARLLHRDAEAIIFNAGSAATEPDEQPAFGEDIEHGDLLGYPHRVMPGQDDDCRAEF